jgi:hypothetical protein
VHAFDADQGTVQELHTDVSSLVQVTLRFQRLLEEFTFSGDGDEEEADFESLEREVERIRQETSSIDRSRSRTTRPSGRRSARRSPRAGASRATAWEPARSTGDRRPASPTYRAVCPVRGPRSCGPVSSSVSAAGEP